MKPVRLVIDGINSFSERREIDFTLLGGRLFCVCGPTGSGKTTILDCMILALYGDCGRGGGTGSGGALLSDYINLKRDDAFVEFEFIMGGKTYCVQRNFRRDKDGKAHLYEDGNLVSSQKTEINRIIENAVGLSRADFTQVVVLEQGQFDKFLKRGGKERSVTVSNLFKLDKFKDLSHKANARIAKVNGKIESCQRVLNAYGGFSEERLKECTANLEQREKNGGLYAEQLRIIEERLRNYEEQKKKNERFRQVREQLDEAKNSRGELLTGLIPLVKSEEKYLADTLIQLNSKLNGLKAQAEDAALKKSQCQEEAQALAKRRADALEYISSRYKYNGKAAITDVVAGALNDFKRLKREQSEINNRLKAFINDENELVNSIKNKKNLAEIAENDLKVAFEAFAKAQKENALSVVCKGLDEGDDCPVCHSTLNQKPEFAGDGNEKKLEDAYKKAQKNIEDIRLSLAAYNEKLIYTKRLIDETKEQLRLNLSALEATFINLDCTDEEIALMQKAADLSVGWAKRIGDLTNQSEIFASQEVLLKDMREPLLSRTETIESQIKLNSALLKELTTGFDGGGKNMAIIPYSQDISEKIAAKKSELALLQARIDMLSKESVEDGKNSGFDNTAYEALNNQYSETKKLQSDNLVQTGALTNEIHAIKDGLIKKEQVNKEAVQLNKLLIRLQLLAKLLKGEKFLDYVAEEYIAAFTATASNILNTVSSGRYGLIYERSESRFYVSDFYSGGKQRKINTLSGGETFLASLALSSAISAHISSANHEFFFLDEGFGTLDSDAIAVVALALEELSRSSTVGLISHCKELTERISSKITVSRPDEENGSNIEII